MSKLTNRKAAGPLLSFALGALALLSASCGGTDSGFTPIGQSGAGLGAPSGTYDFYGFCAQRRGTVIYGQGGTQLCKIIRDFSSEYVMSINAAFPVLTPNDPESAMANPKLSPFYVKRGDRLKFSAGTSSGWIVKDCGSVCSYLYNENKLDGSDVGYHQGLRSGLVASIGGNAPFLLGYGFDAVLEQEGHFRYGYNVAVSQSDDIRTHSVSVGAFRILHCENMLGETVTCP